MKVFFCLVKLADTMGKGKENDPEWGDPLWWHQQAVVPQCQADRWRGSCSLFETLHRLLGERRWWWSPSPAAGNSRRSSQSASSPLWAASVVRPRLAAAEHMLGTWIREDRESERRSPVGDIEATEALLMCRLKCGQHVAFWSQPNWLKKREYFYISSSVLHGKNWVKIQRVDLQCR